MKSALDGESTASKKYLEYSKVAQKEGHEGVAYLFLALSEAEQKHIRNHKNALKEEYDPEIGEYEAGTTIENLEDSIQGETWETEEMYPGFLKDTKGERFEESGKVARLSMKWAEEVEKTHAEVLQEALNALRAGKEFEAETIYVCRFCGNLVLELPEKICPVCKHDKRFYEKIKRPGGNL